MELPKISLPSGEPGGVLDNIKSRFGLSGNEKEDSRRGHNDAYDDGYDDYDDGYDDYDDGYDNYDDRDADYQPYAQVTTRPAGRSTYSSSPRLVTINDVKSNSYDRYSRSADSDSRYGGLSDRTSSSSSYSSASSYSQRDSRSEGINSLFTPAVSSASFGLSASRAVKVIRPMAYGDVEDVARLVRGGDIVVLALKATPESLYNRVLDFSFGVVSALDAHVDCIAPKVFAISTGAGMTDAEKTVLQGQGVL